MGINNQRLVSPGPNGTLIGEKGETLTPPFGWAFLPAGDAGITRKVTVRGSFWRVQIKMGRRWISKGIWAPSDLIAKAQAEVDSVRKTDDYKKKRDYNLYRREKQQAEYEVEFCNAVESYLHFHSRYTQIEKQMAKAITIYAVPVGSGTVARTAMIPVEERAAKAVIAWMRHQTTAYENLNIPHIKGERRAVRRQLAQQSVSLLSKYRTGEDIPVHCPLQYALRRIQQTKTI